jgi:hypothetical protein
VANIDKAGDRRVHVSECRLIEHVGAHKGVKDGSEVEIRRLPIGFIVVESGENLEELHKQLALVPEVGDDLEDGHGLFVGVNLRKIAQHLEEL